MPSGLVPTLGMVAMTVLVTLSITDTESEP